MAPQDFPAGGYPADYARFWVIWVLIVGVTWLVLRRRPGRVAAAAGAKGAGTATGARTSVGRLVLGNALVFLSLLWTVVLAGESYLRYVYDQSDSYGLTLTSFSWFRRHVYINSGGFRDREFDTAPPAGATLVACIGDSFTQGWGVEEPGDCWPQRVGAMLAEGDRGTFEVRNYGRAGENSGNAIVAVRELARAGGVGRVILGYCLNDADDLAPPGQSLDRGKVPRVPWIPPTFSFVADFLWFRLRLRDDPRVRGYFDWVAEQYADPRIMALQTERFREMKELADGGKVRLDVVVFPMFSRWGEGYPFDAAHDRVALAWKSVGVDVVDLREAYRGIPGTELVVNRFDGHPNARAHAIAARAVVERLFPKR